LAEGPWLEPASEAGVSFFLPWALSSWAMSLSTNSLPASACSGVACSWICGLRLAEGASTEGQ
jgi:hypothetical protein